MLSSLIQQVKVGAICYQIETPDKIEETRGDETLSYYGRAIHSEGRILICNKHPFDRQRQTLLHECFHAIFNDFRLSNFLPEDTEEDLVLVLEAAIGAFLVDNPDFVKLYLLNIGLLIGDSVEN